PGEPAGSGDSTTPEGGTGAEAPAPATADRALSVESADLARLQGAPETAPVEPETAAPEGETEIDAADLGVGESEPAPAEAEAEPAPAPAPAVVAEDTSPGL